MSAKLRKLRLHRSEVAVIAAPEVEPRLGTALTLTALVCLPLLLLEFTLAPDPVVSNRQLYEYNVLHPLDPACPSGHYCHRVLAPLLVRLLPVAWPAAWYLYSLIFNLATALLLCLLLVHLSGSANLGVLGGVSSALSYGAAYTLYDPWSPDPLVFFLCACILYVSIVRWYALAALAAALGAFTKELPVIVPFLLLMTEGGGAEPRRRGRMILASAVPIVVTLAFHLAARYDMWKMRGAFLNEYLDIMGWKATLLYAVAPFRMLWLFAALGLRSPACGTGSPWARLPPRSPWPGCRICPAPS